MEKFICTYDNEETKYVQICNHIKDLIKNDELEDGEKLPTIRSLSDFLGVNKITIINAYKKLEQEGYAVSKMGSGTFAKKRDFNISFKRKYSEIFKTYSKEQLSKYIDFTGEVVKGDNFPVDVFKKVLNEVIDRDGAEAFIHQESLGYDGLRKSISNNFWHKSISIDNILIVSGAQQGIDIVSKALIDVNDNVIVEKPTYIGALSVFKWRRANILEVDIMKDGIDINQLEEILKKTKIKCFYVMSYFQNPTGISYSEEKKKKILELAQQYDFYIIEDDYLSELIYNEELNYKSFKALDNNDRVIYIKSFSKIFLPGIRLGYLIPPKEFKESIISSKVNTDISTSSLMQRALGYYIDEGLWIEYIEKLNCSNKKKYRLLVELINSKLGEYVQCNYPEGGLHIYFTLKSEGMDSVQLFYKCKKKGVLITPGVLFFKNSKDGLKSFRINFSEVTLENIEKGIEVIENVLKHS